MKRMKQLELNLPAWGGKRKGSGRKPKGDKAGVSHARRPQFKSRHPVHVTMRLLPGVGELLDSLAARDDVALGLLTGNWEQGGRIKIGRYHLNRYFPFGSFGDDGMDRNELPPIALARAKERTRG